MQGVPEQFNDERDSARFRHLAQLPGVRHWWFSEVVRQSFSHPWYARRRIDRPVHLTCAFTRRYGITPVRYQKQALSR